MTPDLFTHPNNAADLDATRAFLLHKNHTLLSPWILSEFFRQLVPNHPELISVNLTLELMREPPDTSISALDPKLRQSLNQQLGDKNLESLFHLVRENNPVLQLQGLIHLSERLKNQYYDNGALLILAMVRDLAGTRFTEQRLQAEKLIAAMEGEGSFGDQLESFGRQLCHETLSISSLGSIAGAQFISSLSYFGFLSLFRYAPKGSILTNPLVTRSLSYLGAFALETSSLVGLRHGFMRIVDSSHPLNSQLLWLLCDELWSSSITIGALRLTGGLRTLIGPVAKTAPSFVRVSNWMLPEVAAIGGIFLGYLGEQSLGLRPLTKPATILAQSLATYGHFKIAGHALRKLLGPNAAAWQQELQLKTRLLELNFSHPENMVLTFINGGYLPAASMPTEDASGWNGPMLAQAYEELPSSTPQSGRGLRNGKTRRPNPWVARIERLGRWIAGYDLVQLTDPTAPLRALRRAPVPDPVESLETGMLLTIANGNPGRRHIWHARRVMDLTRRLPLTRAAYIEAENARLKFRRAVGTRLDPILQSLKDLPGYAKLAADIGAYEKTVQQVLGAHYGTVQADALLNAVFAKRISAMHNKGIPVSTEKLLELGYEPKAVEWASKHADAFLPGTVEAIIRRYPSLHSAPGAAEVLTAFEGPDPQARREALGRFLSSPETQALWLAQIALDSSVRGLLRQNPNDFTKDVLANAKFDSDPEFTERKNRFLAAAENLKREQQTMSSGGLVDKIAGTFGIRNFQTLHRAMGQYQATLIDLLFHHENELIPIAIDQLENQAAKLPTDHLANLEIGRRDIAMSHLEVIQTAGSTIASLDGQVRDFFQFYDDEITPLRAMGTQVGLTHVMELFEQAVRPQIDPETYAKEIAPKLQDLQQRYQSASDKYKALAPKSRNGMLNPRDFNRQIEAQLQIINQEAYGFLETTAAGHHIDLGDWRRILPMFETYAHKADLPREIPPIQRYFKIARYLRPTIPRVFQFSSAMARGYSYDLIARLFLDYGAQIGENANSQTYFVDPDMAKVSNYFGYTISLDHNSHVDFAGHVVNLVQALQAQGIPSHQIRHFVETSIPEAPHILAKFDLDIPIIKQVFPYLTNLIPNQRDLIRGKEILSARMQAFGSLKHDRLRPTMPAGFDSLTMDVTNGENPYGSDPHSAVSGSLPVFGRLFGISEMAATLTGRPQGMLFANNPGAIRNYPSQRGTLSLLNNPSSMIAHFFPLRAFAEPVNGEKLPARNHFERLWWYLQGFHPELNPPAPDTDALYTRYARPLDPATEQAVANLFGSAWEVYPNAQGIADLEAKRHSLQSELAALPDETARQASSAYRRLQLIDQVLDIQTRQLLDIQLALYDQRIDEELAVNPDSPEAQGLQRMQRILRARAKTLSGIQNKANQDGELTLTITERKFLEKAGAAITGRENTSGTDHALEQLEYYFAMRDIGVNLDDRLFATQNHYYQLIQNWNEARKDPENREYHQIHVSEAAGYQEAWADYRKSIETLFQLRGITPERYNGEIFPDISFRREGSDLIIEPKQTRLGDTGLSVRRIWSFFLDTVGIVSLAKKAVSIDPSLRLYQTLHRGWGQRTIDQMNTRVRVQDTEQLRDLEKSGLLAAPTHDSAAEFPILPMVLHDYGIQAFFLADRKFFDPPFAPREFKLFGKKTSVLFPKFPFGAIRFLLGPMELYGHFSIDRTDPAASLESMKRVGASARETGRTAIIFPAGTRNSVGYTEDGKRFETTLYGSKPGIGLSWEGSKGLVLPIGLKNGGVIMPKQFLKSMVTEGVMLGQEYGVRFGTPLHYSTVVEGNPRPSGPQLRKALVPRLDAEYARITGRRVGPPAPSKVKGRSKPQ